MASVSSVSILQSAGGALKLALLPQIISSPSRRFGVRILFALLVFFLVKWIFWDSKVSL